MSFPSKYDWASIDPLLIALYPRGVVGSLDDLAGLLGVPLHRLSGRAAKLRREGRLHGYIRRRWTPAEEAKLVELYPHHDIAVLARRFGCKKHNLRERAYKAGASRMGVNYSATDVATAIGCSVGAVCEWCRSGLIQVRLVDRRWVVSEKALRAFLLAERTRLRRFPCPGRAWLDGILTDYKPPTKTDTPARRTRLNYDAARYEGGGTSRLRR